MAQIKLASANPFTFLSTSLNFGALTAVMGLTACLKTSFQSVCILDHKNTFTSRNPKWTEGLLQTFAKSFRFDLQRCFCFLFAQAGAPSGGVFFGVMIPNVFQTSI